jgi:hypothetical protein
MQTPRAACRSPRRKLTTRVPACDPGRAGDSVEDDQFLSVPWYFQGGGIPELDDPNRAICRCNYTGSAPAGRDDVTRNIRGSTSRKCEAIVTNITLGGPRGEAALRPRIE